MRISYEQLHRLHNRATQDSLMKYKLAIQLFKSFNDCDQNDTWISLNFQQNFGQRNHNVTIIDNSTHKVGRNMLINRLNTVNGKIPCDWLNLTIDSFEIKCKTAFLMN